MNMSIKTGTLSDLKINIKIKLASLWAAVMCCYIYGDYFSLYVPKQIEKFINVQTLLDAPEKLLGGSILMAIPSLMIFLSIALKASINRWLNIIFGIIYTAIMVLIATTSGGSWWMFYKFLAILESILTLLIVWNAVKWPKQFENLKI